ncbi:MAG: Flp family type IVb pilin [Azospirillaceae bacterium]
MAFRVLLLRMLRGERGASAIEYAIIAALIAAVIIGALFALGGVVTDQYDSVSEAFENRTINQQ